MNDAGPPAFNKDEVALLISAVEQALQHLRAANERMGGNDAEMLGYGRRYSVILQKLESVAQLNSAGAPAS